MKDVSNIIRIKVATNVWINVLDNVATNVWINNVLDNVWLNVLDNVWLNVADNVANNIQQMKENR